MYRPSIFRRATGLGAGIVMAITGGVAAPAAQQPSPPPISSPATGAHWALREARGAAHNLIVGELHALPRPGAGFRLPGTMAGARPPTEPALVSVREDGKDIGWAIELGGGRRTATMRAAYPQHRPSLRPLGDGRWVVQADAGGEWFVWNPQREALTAVGAGYSLDVWKRGEASLLICPPGRGGTGARMTRVCDVDPNADRLRVLWESPTEHLRSLGASAAGRIFLLARHEPAGETKPAWTVAAIRAPAAGGGAAAAEVRTWAIHPGELIPADGSIAPDGTRVLAWQRAGRAAARHQPAGMFHAAVIDLDTGTPRMIGLLAGAFDLMEPPRGMGPSPVLFLRWATRRHAQLELALPELRQTETFEDRFRPAARHLILADDGRETVVSFGRPESPARRDR